jgi:hypothetical protein
MADWAWAMTSSWLRRYSLTPSRRITYGSRWALDISLNRARFTPYTSAAWFLGLPVRVQFVDVSAPVQYLDGQVLGVGTRESTVLIAGGAGRDAAGQRRRDGTHSKHITDGSAPPRG